MLTDAQRELKGVQADLALAQQEANEAKAKLALAQQEANEAKDEVLRVRRELAEAKAEAASEKAKADELQSTKCRLLNLARSGEEDIAQVAFEDSKCNYVAGFVKRKHILNMRPNRKPPLRSIFKQLPRPSRRPWRKRELD